MFDRLFGESEDEDEAPPRREATADNEEKGETKGAQAPARRPDPRARNEEATESPGPLPKVAQSSGLCQNPPLPA